MTKKFLMKYNGWLGFVVASLLFFAAPPLYRLIDPTAGQFDAGYLHPIIYASVVVCFASGLANVMLILTAPGLHEQLDKFLDGTCDLCPKVKFGYMLYALYFIAICTTVWFVI
jgi:hypothetical protein